MPKFQVESLIHINAVYLVEADDANAAAAIVDKGLQGLELVRGAADLPELESPSAVIADAEAIGVYPEGEPIP